MRIRVILAAIAGAFMFHMFVVHFQGYLQATFMFIGVVLVLFASWYIH